MVHSLVISPFFYFSQSSVVHNMIVVHGKYDFQRWYEWIISKEIESGNVMWCTCVAHVFVGNTSFPEVDVTVNIIYTYIAQRADTTCVPCTLVLAFQTCSNSIKCSYYYFFVGICYPYFLLMALPWGRFYVITAVSKLQRRSSYLTT